MKLIIRLYINVYSNKKLISYFGNFYRYEASFTSTFSNGISNIQSNKNNILIYPNPTNDKFIIQIENQNVSYNLEILNTIGQVVLTKKIINSIEQVDLSGQVAGVYFVKLQSENSMIVRKIIKQ